MMTTADQDALKDFIAKGQTPCLSLYMPTHRHHPENRQDPIRFGNLVKLLEKSLLLRYQPRQVNSLLTSFRTLGENNDFWRHTWDGVAVLGDAGSFRVIKLHHSVAELAVVANSFHIKPLIRILQSADRYQVLALNRRDIRLFEGDRDKLDEVELAVGVPHNINEALGDELTEPSQTVSSHGGTSLGSSMRHGQGSKKDEVEIDEERFFRAVDRAIMEYHSRPSGLPLILALLAEYHALFQKVSHNPFLMDKAIDVDASAITIDQLRERAWALVEPECCARVRSSVSSFEEALSKDLGSSNLAEVAQAAADSRVDCLLVEAERQIPGHLADQTGDVTLERMNDPQVDDMLDDLAELVLSKGGQVLVVPAVDMPTTTGVAATFRF